MNVSQEPMPRRAAAAAALLLVPALVASVLTHPVPALAGTGAALAALAILLRSDWVVYLVVAVSLLRADAWLTLATGLPFGSIAFAAFAAAFFISASHGRAPLAGPNRAFATYSLFLASAFLVGVLAGDRQYASLWGRDAAAAWLTFATIYCFTGERDRATKVLRLIVACGVIVSLVNLVELFDPSLVRMSTTEGRAAGLLRNANSSALVITLSFVVFQLYRRVANRRPGVGSVSVQVIMILGVLATFSRGGMTMLFLAITGAVLIEAGDGRSPWPLVASVGAAALAAAGAIHHLLHTSDPSVLNYFAKVTAFVEGHIDDNYRFDLARFYLDKFLAHPLTGYGFGSAVEPSSANADLYSTFGVQGPHNTAIAVLTEFGVLTFAVYASFVASLWAGIRRIGSTPQRRYTMLLLFVLLAGHAFHQELHIHRASVAVFAVLASLPIALPGRSKDSTLSPKGR